MGGQLTPNQQAQQQRPSPLQRALDPMMRVKAPRPEPT